MRSNEDTITLKCDRCGSTSFTFARDPERDDMITCAHCGATGSYTEFQEKTVKSARREMNHLIDTYLTPDDSA